MHEHGHRLFLILRDHFHRLTLTLFGPQLYDVVSLLHSYAVDGLTTKHVQRVHHHAVDDDLRSDGLFYGERKVDSHDVAAPAKRNVPHH